MSSILNFILAVFTAYCVISNCSEQKINPDVAKAADFAISEYNHMSNSASAFKIVDFLSDSAELYPPTRVKYTIKVSVAQTSCPNIESVNLNDCNLIPNAQHMTCSFVVLAVPGENTLPRYLLTHHCNY